jgi:hypothetical protein
MKTLQKIWRRITTTRYARALEEEILPHMRAQQAEITRLRSENRALLNSILGIAGLPPIVVAAPSSSSAEASTELHTGVALSSVPGAAPDAVATSRAKSAAVAAPMRRRSWQQIHRALEFAAVQKKERQENPSS